jgi:hypothetical protein
MSKLFNIVQKSKEGQCDAMRCSATENLTYIEGGMVFGRPVMLCEKHLEQFGKWMGEHPTDPIAYIGDEKVAINPDAPQQIDLPLATVEIKPSDGVSTSSLGMALRDLPIDVHTEQSALVRQVAEELEITDQTTLNEANELIAIVHSQEKEFKAGVDAVKKPINQLKKYVQDRTKQLAEDYATAKKTLNSKISTYLRDEKARQNAAQEAGNHEAVQQHAVETPSNVCTVTKREYSIKNDGANLPIDFLVPDETKIEAIVRLLPREYLRPNYDLIESLVKQHGRDIEIPDVEVIEYEETRMKPIREMGY